MGSPLVLEGLLEPAQPAGGAAAPLQPGPDQDGEGRTPPTSLLWLPAPGERPLVLRDAPDGRGAAAYRRLRARLRRQGDPQLIGVTGLEAAVVAANLALAFAEGRRRAVALVEADGGRRGAELLPRAEGSSRGDELPVGGVRLRSVERVDLFQPPPEAAGPEGGALEALLIGLREAYDYAALVLEPGVASTLATLLDVVLVSEAAPEALEPGLVILVEEGRGGAEAYPTGV